jgi:hypothetical protein
VSSINYRQELRCWIALKSLAYVKAGPDQLSFFTSKLTLDVWRLHTKFSGRDHSCVDCTLLFLLRGHTLMYGEPTEKKQGLSGWRPPTKVWTISYRSAKLVAFWWLELVVKIQNTFTAS